MAILPHDYLTTTSRISMMLGTEMPKYRNTEIPKYRNTEIVEG
ncbi:MAG: hypothetical protein AAF662_00895 [Pseudomonadota bacterium]